MSVFICLSLKSSMIERSGTDVLEKDYQTVFKPALKFMLSHPNLRLSLFLNGIQFEYYKRKHSEIFEIFQQLITKKQLELLGGGYYDPVFPLLFPRDRTGQIDFLSSTLRETTGKRPRGLSICGSAWESSLLSSFVSCGMEYVLLDDSLIPPEKNKAIPLIMSDKGKSITILPVKNDLKPDNTENVFDFLGKIDSFVSKSSKNLDADISKCVFLQFSIEEFKSLFESGFIKELEKICSVSDGRYELSIPQQFLKENVYREPVYIAAGLSKEIAQWAYKPYEAVKTNKTYPITVFDFLQIYPQSRALYDRMLYVSLLVNQGHGDKIRKKTARDKLWEAQTGDGFICTSKGAFVNSSYRQHAYKILSEVEKIIRECEDFSESISCFDYNGDGFNEYIARMDSYFAEISLTSGAVRELDVIMNSGNFADNLSRVRDFEGIDDGYERGLFVDHLFSDSEFDKYLNNLPFSSVIFSRKRYSEIKYSSGKKEVQLQAKALFGQNQAVSLKKKYLLTSSGMMVQYILRNESDRQFNAKFAVESSFAQINFNSEKFNPFKLEILSNEEKKEIDTNSSSHVLNDSGKLLNVQGYLVTDTDNSVSFMFEPNESCGLSFVPIIFKRPEYTTGEIVSAGMTFANTIFWDIKLEPGMETEKTINFSIFNQHKKKKSLKK